MRLGTGSNWRDFEYHGAFMVEIWHVEIAALLPQFDFCFAALSTESKGGF